MPPIGEKSPIILANQTAYYISIGEEWTPPVINARDNTGKTIPTTYTGSYNISEENEYKLTYIAEDSEGRKSKELYVYLYVSPNEGRYGSLPNDYPEMNDNNLEDIKGRWDTERNKLQVNYPLDDFNIFEYYQTLEGLEGEAFFIQLQNIISAVQQVTYNEARFILELSDAKHSMYGSYLYGIYDSEKLVRYWDNAVEGVTATMDREHVWPQSYLTLKAADASRSMATDVHNLRIILKSTNTSRQNHYFVSGSGQNLNMGNGGTYYPGDDHRGDVARILFYMHVRYSEDLFLTNNDLDILNYKTDGIKIDGRIPFGLLDILLQWHEEDPPDEFEIQRNNIIYMYQGNRNPFIDYPEYANIIFNIETSSGQSIEVEVTFVNMDLNFSDLKPKTRQYLN